MKEFMAEHIKFNINDRVVYKRRFSRRGIVVSAFPDPTPGNIIGTQYEIIWDGDNHVSVMGEAQLIAENLVPTK
jgi:hypothetical protein